jgi:N-acetylglucosamine-6-phosphate deacetylase
MEGTYDAVCGMAAAHSRFGTTALLPTTVAWSIDEQLRALQAIAEATEKGTGTARVLGAHMETPFLNRKKAGAHNPSYLKEPSIELLAKFYEASRGTLRIITIAPELPGAPELIAYARSKGIIVSAGHSLATFEEGQAAIKSGVALCAHLFNAMPPISARDPGLAVAFLDSDEAMVEVITDGVHVHPGMLELAIKSKHASKVLVVSDATPPAGTDDQVWELEGQKVNIVGFTGYLEDGTICGSALTMGSAFRVLCEKTGTDVADAALMCASNQARLLGERHKGEIALGKDADLVILDTKLRVRLTMIEGTVVYEDLR